MSTSANKEESTKVILLAFLANFGIAIAKFVGAYISASTSLLAEAIHSLVDCSNQILLLVGNKKSKKPADQKHPLGYGREAFFWSFIVAILLFSLGGLFAIYEGVHKIHETGEVSSPLLGFCILFFSMLLEGYSFLACLKEVKSQNTFGNLWEWFKNTKNSELLVIFTEDAAALVGLTIATICLGIAWVTGQVFWDAIGSILVGILLVVVAVLLATEVKSFIIGEASSDDIKDFFTSETLKYFPDGRVLNFISIQAGIDEVMLSCKIHPGSITRVDQAIGLVNQLEKATKEKFKSVRWQFVELDYED
jgi:cation diffusion facilitator family transporter